MSSKSGDIVPYSEFLQKNKKPMMRPCVWKWKEIYPKLMESVGKSSLEAGRGAVSLVHNDVDSGGVAPHLNVVVQVLKPGEHNAPHRHSNVALFLAFQGEGYSIVDGEKVEWEKGDLVLAPAWSEHEHCNTSETEDAILVTFQDVPLVSDMGVWFLEEPVGEPPRHIVEEKAKSDNT